MRWLLSTTRSKGKMADSPVSTPLWEAQSLSV